MKNLAISFGLGVISVVLFACSGSSPGGSSSTSSAISGGTAEAGEPCGGFVAHTRACDEGQNLYCKSGSLADAPGTCTSCDGFGLLPRFVVLCADGSQGRPHWVAKDGTCKMVTCADEIACNDFASCPTGLVCNASNGGEGVCMPASDAGADAGRGCNDFDSCPDGFTCTGHNGGPGVCVPASDGGADAGRGCNDFDSCPEGFVCNAKNGGEGICVAQ